MPTNVLLASHFRARPEDPIEPEQPIQQLHKADQHDDDDVGARLDAARALLGVGPSSVESPFRAKLTVTAVSNDGAESPSEQRNPVIAQRRPRSNSAGLDALAFLATTEHASMGKASNEHIDTSEHTANAEPTTVTSIGTVAPLPGSIRPPALSNALSSSCSSATSSEDDDSAAMPPPPPRQRRRRSMSNPEGMEKYSPAPFARLHFVLPASILEEELAEANAAMIAKAEETQNSSARKRSRTNSLEDDHDDDDDAHLSQDELLRRARSRLLEDLSEGNINGEKGVLTLPHSLAKYKEIYNKNGRVGIYTPAERAAIISRFHDKRSRRVWNKKIRYNCRKNLADRRMRVKGRFVKRSTEQEAKLAATSKRQMISLDLSALEESTKPDLNDPDAGFCPTEDQPYRRLRRHTFT